LTPQSIVNGQLSIVAVKLLVTGGAGFIGSALVRSLLRTYPRADIVVIDNFSTGKKENLAEVVHKIEIKKVDIRNFQKIKPLFAGTDIVFHEAAIPSVPKSIDNPIPSHQSNIDGTFNVLLAAQDAGVKRVIYAASSSAYGDAAKLPKTETMAPDPKSPYAIQKLTGEYYLKCFGDIFGIQTVALRYFNVFGPRQDPDSPYSGIISVFAKAILERKAPTIFGDGLQSRDFTFVEDAVQLNLLAAKAAQIKRPLYNGGTGKRYTLNQIWKIFQELEGIKLPIKYAKPRLGDVKHSQADIRAARNDFDYKPRYSIRDGLKQTLEWYKNSIAQKSGK